MLRAAHSGIFVAGFHALFDDDGLPLTAGGDGASRPRFALVADQRYDEALAALGRANCATITGSTDTGTMLLGGVRPSRRAPAFSICRPPDAPISAAGEAAAPIEAAQAFVGGRALRLCRWPLR